MGISDWRLRIDDSRAGGWACRGGRLGERSQCHNGKSVGEFFFFSVLPGRRYAAAAWREAAAVGRCVAAGGLRWA